MASESGYKLKQLAIITYNENMWLYISYLPNQVPNYLKQMYLGIIQVNTDINLRYSFHAWDYIKNLELCDQFVLFI